MLTAPELKQFMGITTTDTNLDQVVDWAVAATNVFILERCSPYLNDSDPWDASVEYIAKLQGARLVKRRASPEGVAGFGDLGMVRVSGLDPDIESMLTPHLWLAFS
jgi:hypothetical protein